MSQHREEKQSNEEEWGEDDEEMVVLAFGDNGDGQIGVGLLAWLCVAGLLLLGGALAELLFIFWTADSNPCHHPTK